VIPRSLEVGEFLRLSFEQFRQLPALWLDGRTVSYAGLYADAAKLGSAILAKTKPGEPIGVLAQRSPLGAFRHVTWVNAGTRPDNYAHDLYANLRTLDKTGATCLLVQEVPADARWDAIRDRLARAAAATPATLEGLP